MEAMRLAPGKVTRNYVGGEGMDTVFNEDAVESLLAQGEGGDILSTMHIVKRKGMHVGAILNQLRAAKTEGRPLIDVVRGVEDARVTTLVEPGPDVVHQAVRQGRGRRVVTDEPPESAPISLK
jgi:intracellular sulfur oxidation DsrE/DsrF family protein